tara:strand:- start:603 stop:950 length:348 start_codon:yes stop_codon:yes gene_type:complete
MTNSKRTASIELIEGVAEVDIPQIKLYRNTDRKSGEALFLFNNPQSIRDGKIDLIRKMVMIDKEGQILTSNVNIKVKKDNSFSIEAKYIWKSYLDFQRLMRFADRYSQSNTLITT